MAISLNKGILIGNLGRDPEIRSSSDGKEIAREPGATWEPRSFQATIPDGNRSMKVDANTRFSKSPRGLRFTVSVDGKEIYSEVKWPPRWYLPFAGVGLMLALAFLRLAGY